MARGCPAAGPDLAVNPTGDLNLAGVGAMVARNRTLVNFLCTCTRLLDSFWQNLLLEPSTFELQTGIQKTKGFRRPRSLVTPPLEKPLGEGGKVLDGVISCEVQTRLFQSF